MEQGKSWEGIVLKDKDREGFSAVPNCEGYYARALFTSGETGRVESLLAYMEPGGGGPSKEHTHKHDHLFVVMEGEMLIKQGRKRQTLEAPGAVLVPGGKPHSIWNAGNTDLELVVVNLDPAITQEAAAGAPVSCMGEKSRGGKARAEKKFPAGERKAELARLVRDFCDRFLDEEYRGLCGRIIEELSGMQEPPFLSGRVEIWAAGVIHAIGTINFLFDPSMDPYVSMDELADYFGVSKSSVTNRSGQIRRLLNIERFDEERSTTFVKSTFPYFFTRDLADLQERFLRAQATLERSLREARKKAMARTTSSSPFSRVYQFRIYLAGSEPYIWRRIQVPEHYSFWGLHLAIQDAMGWLDCHLHRFVMPRPGERQPSEIGIPDPEYIGAGPGGTDIVVLPGWEEKIAAWFTPDNALALYEYDFGDSWLHTIVLEQILPRERGVTYPRCIDGARACPPEDCGGIGGYEELLEVLTDPSHKEHEKLLEWLEEPFDPEEFSPDDVDFDDPDERFLEAFSD